MWFKSDYDFEELGTWQKHLSSYFRRQLNTLKIDDPFLITGSKSLVENLGQWSYSAVTAFFIDIEDFYYSVPHADLFLVLRDIISESGEIQFQNSAGTNSGSFLALLEFYLASTATSSDGQYYIQKRGICIGSAVAPYLCDIFLSTVDKRIQANLFVWPVAKVFRYVDDYFIILSTSYEHNCGDVIRDVLGILSEQGAGLTFTWELPTDAHIQFLDVELEFSSRTMH